MWETLVLLCVWLLQWVYLCLDHLFSYSDSSSPLNQEEELFYIQWAPSEHFFFGSPELGDFSLPTVGVQNFFGWVSSSWFPLSLSSTTGGSCWGLPSGSSDQSGDSHRHSTGLERDDLEQQVHSPGDWFWIRMVGGRCGAIPYKFPMYWFSSLGLRDCLPLETWLKYASFTWKELLIKPSSSIITLKADFTRLAPRLS